MAFELPSIVRSPHMKMYFVALASVFFISATSLRADLLGTTVNGSLTFNGGSVNYFDAANGFVPARFGNSTSPNNVTIGSGVEFGFNDGVNRDIANFGANTLLVRDVCLLSGVCGSAPFLMRFTDLAFASASLTSNELGINFSFSGNVLTINFPGGVVPDSNATATFLIGAAQTPEPGTMALVATGVLGAAGVLRRRLVA